MLERYVDGLPRRAVFAVDGEMTLAYCNRGFRETLGLSAAPVGTGLGTLLAEPGALAEMPRPAAGDEARVTLVFRTGDGRGDRRLEGRLFGTGAGLLFLEAPAAEGAGEGREDRAAVLEKALARMEEERDWYANSLRNAVSLHNRIQDALQASHRFLEITNRHTELRPLLDEFVDQVRRMTGCEAVGMRILDEEGNIPYYSYQGFSQSFYDSESPLSIQRHQCMCIYVIRGEADPTLSFYTKGGSFFMTHSTRQILEAKPLIQGGTRNVCQEFGYETVALIPIRLGDRILGLIHLADTRCEAITLRTIETLEWAAMQLGTAIQRVVAEDALRKANEELEKRIEERTAELVKTSAQFREEAQKRKEASQALLTSQEDLRILSARLLTAQEDERKRMARELHDSIGQSLSAIKFTVENVLQEMADREACQGIRTLESAIRMVQDAVEEVRRIQRNLRPPTLDDLGILATISWYCRNFQEVYAGIRIEPRIGLAEEDVPDRIKIVLYRILQEALNNVAKHSGADRVLLSLAKRDGRIEMEIRDNGSGFDPREVFAQESTDRGLGLFSMKERAELAGGTFLLDTEKGKGTTIRVSWAS